MGRVNGLLTWCGQHEVIVRPATYSHDGTAYFGSAADFCDEPGCEDPVISSVPLYEAPREQDR